MTNSKPFKTHNQQMKILRTRGLAVESNDKRTLENYGYYSVINGYKWPFLKRDENGSPLSPEEYIDKASLREITALYQFDKELRCILYDALIEYEENLKAELSYRFSEKYREEHSYLAIDNYSRNPQNPQSVKGVVDTISKLSNSISKNFKKKGAINHYVNKHGHVPLWVLVNFLTFGELNFFYKNCTRDIKLSIAKDFSKKYERKYKQKIFISINSIEYINHLVNHFRNAVAHGDITYCKKLNKGPSFKSIKRDLSLTNLCINSQKGVFELIIALRLVLEKKEYSKLTKRMKILLNNYKNKFLSIEFESILKDMNFPIKFENYL